MISNECEVFQNEVLLNQRKSSIAAIEDHDNLVENITFNKCNITVEPIILFYVITMYLQMAVINQYVYYRIAVDNNIIYNISRAYFCNRSSESSNEKEKTDKLQDLNSSYMIYITLSTAFCTILTAPFYSVLSDRFGRRLLFSLPGTGLVLKSLFEVLIIIFNGPVYFFIISEGLYGLFGGFNFAIGLCFSYIADISSSSMRVKRLAILVSVMGIGALITSLITGFWTTEQGYLIPFSISVFFSFLCVIYPFFFLQESPKMAYENESRLTPLEQLRTLITVYGDRPRHETVTLILIMVMYNFYYIAEMSTVGVATTYLLSFPLCLTSVQIGYFNVLNLISMNVGVVISVILLAKFLPELIILLICHVSSMCYSLQMAFSNGPTAVYIAASSNLLSFSAFQFVKGFLSKLVVPHQQGALFGGIALCESVCGALTKVILMYFYNKTFHTLHGMVFLLVALFSIIAFVLTLTAVIHDWRNRHRAHFQELD